MSNVEKIQSKKNLKVWIELFKTQQTLSSDVNVLHVCVDAHKHKRWDPSMLPAVQLST